MKTLTIFHDPNCGLCTAFRAWLEARPKHVAIEFIAYDSPEAGRRFPGLDRLGADRDIVVLADDGRWWQGEPAWITCLWATRDHRDWAFRLASPALRPFVKKAVHLLAGNRFTISRLLRLQSDEALAGGLDSLPTPACAGGTCALPAHPQP